MKKCLLYGALALSIGSPALAAETHPLPAKSDSMTVSPVSIEYLNSKMVPLDTRERKALQLTGQWSRSDMGPYMADGGKLIYVHGASLPTIIGAPMQVCDVELEQGERVNEIVVGDSARWLVESGSAGDTTHLFVKPVDAGLESSAVVTTDRRVYHLRLLSQRTGHTPYVGFVYNETLRRRATEQTAQEAKDKQWQSTTDATGKEIDLAKLHFKYEVEGRALWKPERVYDDGRKTYIRLPQVTKTGEMPVLLVRKGGKDVLVNYRVQDATMMVDGLFETIALVVGVGGDQESVEIRRVQ
jgi:type IV secretion system protein VirB9